MKLMVTEGVYASLHVTWCSCIAAAIIKIKYKYVLSVDESAWWGIIPSFVQCYYPHKVVFHCMHSDDA